mgnify:CR=1 FL=1
MNIEEDNFQTLSRALSESVRKENNLAELLERLAKSPAVPYAYRVEAQELVKEWRNA